jgi:hypothetical protein
MLIEVCMNDPTELQWERGGWICVVFLAVPLLVGVFAVIGDFRQDAQRRQRYYNIRRRARENRDQREQESVVLLMDERREAEATKAKRPPPARPGASSIDLNSLAQPRFSAFYQQPE